MKKIDRIGEVINNTDGTPMKIIEYNKAIDIIVEFQDEYKAKVSTRYQQFKDGKVKNPYSKSVYNVGYLGQGKYIPKECKKIYNEWFSMIQRCYDPYYINKYPTYKDVFVCDEWHNFQNFAQWWEKNVYNCNNERMELDKDILIKGNKIYSPKTCVIVPQKINYLFTKRQNNRGECVIGVNYEYERNKYRATCNICINNKPSQIVKRFETEIEAFYWYKQQKENHIKQIADMYKNIIPENLYKALYRYEVEIND